jgi:hypothetical protein
MIDICYILLITILVIMLFYYSLLKAQEVHNRKVRMRIFSIFWLAVKQLAQQGELDEQFRDQLQYYYNDALKWAFTRERHFLDKIRWLMQWHDDEDVLVDHRTSREWVQLGYNLGQWEGFHQMCEYEESLIWDEAIRVTKDLHLEGCEDREMMCLLGRHLGNLVQIRGFSGLKFWRGYLKPALETDNWKNLNSFLMIQSVNDFEYTEHDRDHVE